MILLIVLLLIIVSIVLLIMGFQFRKGKWLNLIAGNTFNDYPHNTAIESGKIIGIIMYISSIILIFLAIYILIHK